MNHITSHNLKFFLYARKSSESEDRQVQSLDDQIKELRRLAATSHFEIVEVLSESRSAKMPNNRPVFSAMLDRIKKGEADGILCWHLNRLSRNPVDSGTISWMLQQSVIACIQTMERRYVPDDNVLLFSVESGMANQYIIDLRKHSRRGMEGKAERGWLPSRAPLGYLNNKLERTIIPDPKRFALIRNMWDLMLTGTYRPSQILSIVNEQWGFRSSKFQKVGNDKLSLSVIYHIFSNIFYTGCFRWNGKFYQGNHQPMITVDEFNRVQALLNRRNCARPKTLEFSYTGMIGCGYCTAMITATEKNKLIKSTGETKTYTYYHCTHRKKAITCTQSMPVTLEDLEGQIIDEIKKITIHPQFLTWAIEIIDKQKDTLIQTKKNIFEMQETTLSKTKKELNNLTQLRVRDIINDEEFVQNRNELLEKIAKLERQLLESVDYEEILYKEECEKFQFATYAFQKFINGNKRDKKAILHGLGSNCVLKEKKLFIDKHSWLIPIEKSYQELENEFRRFELTKNLSLKRTNTENADVVTRWLAIVQEVRNEIKKNFKFETS